MAEPTVLFCIGAQKAGTTWLYSYLKSHPDCHLRAPKELRYFNVVSQGSEDKKKMLKKIRARFESERNSRSNKMNARPWYRRTKLAREIRDINEWEQVRSAFQPETGHSAYLHFLQNRIGRKKLVADITPAYAKLGKESFAEMHALAKNVKFLYLLRDPVDRAWSQARMIVGQEGEMSNPEKTARRAISKFINHQLPEMTHLSDYARVLLELNAVIPKKDLRIMFYEQLFDQNSITHLCEFLGIREWPARKDKVINKSPEIALDPKDRKRLALALQDQYHACAEQFGGALPKRWKQQMALAS